MIKRTLKELTSYNALGHSGCTCMRYHGKKMKQEQVNFGRRRYFACGR